MDERKYWAFLSAFLARVSWYINFTSFREVLSSSTGQKSGSNSYSTRVSYDSQEVQAPSCPSQLPQFRDSQRGKNKNNESGEQLWRWGPAYENPVVRSIHSSHPCHHQGEDAERWEQADALQEGFCYLFFFNGDNSLLVEISSRKILG